MTRPPSVSRRASSGIGVAAALVSEWFVDAIDPAVEAIGISKAFTGPVIAAIAANAVENVVAVQLAAKGESDLAISAVKKLGRTDRVLPPPGARPRLAPLRGAADSRDRPDLPRRAGPDRDRAWQITGDGRAFLFEGVALIGLYVVLATLVWSG